eukprot:SAG22_NODE_1919_length_3308_cov_9.137738_2_plen_155_part_00
MDAEQSAAAADATKAETARLAVEQGIMLCPHCGKPVPGAAAASAPAKAADMSLDAWLQSMKLDRYAAAMKDEGYDELEFLKDADQEEVDEMIATIGEQPAPHCTVHGTVRHQLLPARPTLHVRILTSKPLLIGAAMKKPHVKTFMKNFQLLRDE